MSRNLYCPKCKTEYWGEMENAQCNYCKYKFTDEDQRKALGCTKTEFTSNFTNNFTREEI